MPRRDIVVVGASAGGVDALRAVVSRLPADLAATVLVVMHIPEGGTSFLPEILSRAGPLPAIHPDDRFPLEHGRIFIAPPGRHLSIQDGHLRVTGGPTENGFRPAIDRLFRSAAESLGTRVVGVVLSGTLYDGVAGLAEIKRRGGIAIVQDPEEAMFRGMPENALEAAPVDYTLPKAEIGPMLAMLAKGTAPPTREQRSGAMLEEPETGKPSVYSCPDCGGTLWELEGGEFVHYRCRVGHAYSVEGLVKSQDGALERAMWAATRALEESAALSRRLAAQARQRGHEAVAIRFDQKAEDKERNAAEMRKILE